MSILELTAVELGKKIKDKEITVVEATKAALEQIKAVESESQTLKHDFLHTHRRIYHAYHYDQQL